jgi:hypothetical protein
VIGTERGYWLSFIEHAGRVEYEFMHFGNCVAAGITHSVDAMWDLFDSLFGTGP